MENLYSRVSSTFGFEQEREKTWYEKLESDMCGYLPSLTWGQRIWGCMICMTLGFFISMGSMLRFAKLIAGNPVPFATQYTLGNILSILSTCFLYGPLAQAKSMFATTRMITTIVYFMLMGVTMFLAFYPSPIPGRAYILILVILLQFCALCWYTLSFIPFARDIAKNCIMSFCCNCLPAEQNVSKTYFSTLAV